MDSILSHYNDFSYWLWDYRHLLISSWVAVLLVVYGASLNAAVRRIMQPYHFLLRMGAFILLCTFGYGALAVYGELFIQFMLLYFDKQWFGLISIIVFLILSFLAERKKHA
jgi:hypothetical protein